MTYHLFRISFFTRDGDYVRNSEFVCKARTRGKAKSKMKDALARKRKADPESIKIDYYRASELRRYTS